MYNGNLVEVMLNTERVTKQDVQEKFAITDSIYMIDRLVLEPSDLGNQDDTPWSSQAPRTAWTPLLS